MQDIEITSEPESILDLLDIANTYIRPDGKKIIYISEILLDNTLKAFQDAIKAHEYVHLKKKGFLCDDFDPYDIKNFEDPTIQGLIRKYGIDKIPGLSAHEKIRELNDFHRQCTNLIAYYETKGEETRNWIYIIGQIGEEVMEFITEKRMERLKQQGIINDEITTKF